MLNSLVLKLIALYDKPAYQELSDLILSFKNLIDELKKEMTSYSEIQNILFA